MRIDLAVVRPVPQQQPGQHDCAGDRHGRSNYHRQQAQPAGPYMGSIVVLLCLPGQGDGISGRPGKFDKHTQARVALAPSDPKELERMREVGAARLADLLLVSELVLAGPEEAKAMAGERVEGSAAGVQRFASAVLLAQTHKRCERCWTFRPTVGQGEPADLCERCREVISR
jgi:hypothetical protein